MHVSCTLSDGVYLFVTTTDLHFEIKDPEGQAQVEQIRDVTPSNNNIIGSTLVRNVLQV